MTQGRLDIGEQHSYYSPDPMHLPKVDWTTPRLADLPSWRDARRVSIDVETRDPDLRKQQGAGGPGCRRDPAKNYVAGLAFAIEDGPTHYLPINHLGGDNVDGDVWGYVRDQIKDFNGSLVGAGMGYDLDWIANHAPEILTKPVMDVQCADVLINELLDDYDLDALCRRYELPGKDETVMRQVGQLYRVADVKQNLWKLPGRYVAQYGMVDAKRPLQILRRQEKIIADEDLHQVWALEQSVTPILVKMRRRGVRIDVPKLDAIERMALRIENECWSEVLGITGVWISADDADNSSVLAHALRAAGHVVPKTDFKLHARTGKEIGGKDSVTNDWLKKKCGKLGALMVKAREWHKLRRTFCNQVRNALIGDRNHCTFNQLRATDDDGSGRGVRYGRFSCTDYNIQQQPIRNDDFGELWRSIFVADHGARWGCSDWSQQEPRIGVHYAELLELPGAREFADEYRRNPALDIHQKLADLTSIQRKIVKNYVNGRLYGMGDAKLCRSINLPTKLAERYGRTMEVAGDEAQAIIDQFNAFAPWIVGLTRNAARVAEKRGFVWTHGRRKCRFERLPDGKYDKTHKAFNRIGQGSAADQMKATLVAADREGIAIQMAVHDEFDFSFSDIAQARRLKELQMTVVQYSVPMKVDLEIGENWGELEKDVV